jgi:hypothetical protein
MIKTSLLLAFAMAALGQTDDPDDLGPRRIMSGSGTMKSGMTIQYTAYAIPGGKWSGAWGAGGIEVRADKIHRSMIESTTGAYFGYDLTFKGDRTSGYQAVFGPLSTAGGRKLMQPKYPPPQPVRDGDTIALDLMVSPDGTKRIVDYIRFLSRLPEPAAATTTAEPRDFTIDDGAVTYDAWATTVWINGSKLPGTANFTGKPGATFWIALPGRGRYVLSLAPHAGFLKSGAVRDNVISFQDGGREYEVRFMRPVAGRGKAWNLYVLHDQAYSPNPQSRNFAACGADRLDNLLPAR